MKLDGTAPDTLVSELSRLRAEVLPIQLRHALQVHSLPLIHRDPFDRILVAQAQVEKIPIFSSDRTLSQYDVEVIW